jgi:hypothetical protein
MGNNKQIVYQIKTQVQTKSTRLKVITKNISDFFGMAFTHRDKTKYFKKFFSIL